MRRRTSIAPWLGGLVLALCTAGCTPPGEVGAVSVRWRLFDGSSGVPRSGCEFRKDDAKINVVVDTIEVLIRDDLDAKPPCDRCTFPCTALEGTTGFTIPRGRYRIGIRATRCGRLVGATPPPVVRFVK